MAINIWNKVFKSGLRKFCGRQPLKNLLSPLLNTLSHLILVIESLSFFTSFIKKFLSSLLNRLI